MKIYASLRLDSFNILQKDIMEGLNGFRDIKINNKENFFLNNFRTNVGVVSKSLYKISNLMQTPRYIVEIMSITILLVVMLININKIEGTNNIVFLGIFAGASLRLLPSINKLITYINNVKYAIPILNQLVTDIKQNYPETSYERNNFSFSQIGEIKLENVYFHYDQNLKKEDSILKNINLKIRSKEFVGLYATTGSGKSTLIDIISGIIKPNY